MNKRSQRKKIQGKPEDFVFLIVDDDGQVRSILVDYLKSFGFKKILEARDGKAALKIVQDHQQKLTFVISDWEMPHLDGLTLLRATRKDPFRENVKFLMVSSQSSRERIKISEAAKAYVDAYVVKPFRANVLQEKINNLIEHGVDPSAGEFEAELEAIDTKNPPDSYDLSEMNLALICKLSASYQKIKWYDKSIKLCLDALTIFPDSPDLYYLLAHSYHLNNDSTSAIEHLKKAVKLKPYHIEAQTLLAEIGQKKAA